MAVVTLTYTVMYVNSIYMRVDKSQLRSWELKEKYTLQKKFYNINSPFTELCYLHFKAYRAQNKQKFWIFSYSKLAHNALWN